MSRLTRVSDTDASNEAYMNFGQADAPYFRAESVLDSKC